MVAIRNGDIAIAEFLVEELGASVMICNAVSLKVFGNVFDCTKTLFVSLFFFFLQPHHLLVYSSKKVLLCLQNHIQL
jgi:hypothetical protein